MELESFSARSIASSNYVRGWGVWEAFRELYCNALDADPHGMIVDYPSPSIATIYTRTAPTFHECCVVGEGSKEPGTETIGQFGEGLKLAALTAVRAGGSLSIRTPTFTATYELREEKGARHPILYILPRRVPEKSSRPGCLITLTMPGANMRALQANFVTASVAMHPRSPSDTHCALYCKGVLICKHADKPSLFHYNLNELQLNRDRSIASPWSVSCNILQVLLTHTETTGSASFIHDITNDHIENAAFTDYSYYSNSYPKATSRIIEAVHAKYGDRVALPSREQRINELAASYGYTILHTLATGITDFLKSSRRVPTADELIKNDWQPTACALSPDLESRFSLVKRIFTTACNACPLAEYADIHLVPFDHSLAPPNTGDLIARTSDRRIYFASDFLSSDEQVPLIVGALISTCTAMKTDTRQGSLEKDMALAAITGTIATNLIARLP